MKKLLRLLTAISLITIGSARALFRGDLNQIDPDTELLVQHKLILHNQPHVDQVDIYHQQLLYFIQKVTQALENLPDNQILQAEQSSEIKSALDHLAKAREKALEANKAHHQAATSARQPHTNDQVDFHHARLMEELKKAEQHVYDLGYVTMKHRSDMIADILQAEQAAVNANRAHHDQMPNN